MKEFSTLKYERNEGWVTIVLNNPEKHNAMSALFLEELETALWEADNDKSLHAILVKGEGRSFCAGYELGKGADKGLDETRDYRRNSEIDDDIWHIEKSNRRMLTLFDIHKPVVAQVHGNCLAGGTDLALLCDIVICADDATFGFPAARGMGTLPIHMWLYHTSPQWVKRLFLTGDLISGADAAKIGLALKAVPVELLAAECEHLMRRMALIDPAVLAVNKRVVNMGLELMGARTLQRFSAEMDGRGHQSNGCKNFIATMKNQGMKAAFNERDQPFGDSMVSVEKPDAR